jgi:hypothetical protein
LGVLKILAMKAKRVEILRLLAFAVACLLAACTSTDENHPHGASARHAYHTFAIMVTSSNAPASDPGAMARLTNPAMEGVRSSMLAKAYTEARPSEADLLVKLRAEFKPDLLTETTEQRAFIIDIVDRRTGDGIWTGRRDRSSSSTLDAQFVQKTIAEMLAPFPNAAQ